MCLRDAGVPGPVKPVIPDRPGKVVHVLKLLQAACVVYVVFLALFIKWLEPQPLTLFSSILLGIALGIGYSFLHQYYRTRQNQLSELVSPDFHQFHCVHAEEDGIYCVYLVLCCHALALCGYRWIFALI